MHDFILGLTFEDFLWTGPEEKPKKPVQNVFLPCFLNAAIR